MHSLFKHLRENIKNISKALSLIVIANVVFSSCNSDDKTLYTLPSSATVRAFSLSPDKDVLNNLDSVFFSIDLYNREIFNADSLPYGTRVQALTPVITTESASAVELVYQLENGNDTTINYLENTSDTIDFRHPVKLVVTSYDGATQVTYTVRVNVHQLPTDTLVWSRLESGGLPTVFTAVKEQHTAMSPAGMFYCMTCYQEEYCMAYTTDPGGSWVASKIALEFTPDINSLTATSDALYLKDSTGNLYSSTDSGMTWEPTGAQASFILGAYGSRLLTTLQSDNSWSIAEYPSGKQYVPDTDFPVMNTSNAISISFEMAATTQVLVTGGRRADGSLSNTTWGFDGDNWIKVSQVGLPYNLENMAVVPYFDIEPDTISWRVSEPTTVLLALCGNDNASVPNDTVYMSRNFGLTWTKAPESLQISTTAVPSRTLAQAYPYTGISYAANMNKLPAFAKAHVTHPEWRETGWVTSNARLSRVSAPVTDWEVPYIYLFGGVNVNGSTYNTVYRGVITALTFKPLL
ncbi:MAG: hypothetical protein J1F20_07305 [Muribaculaceae bacterium]|nr:hypothetical protein [Muribaculaceae bacterium]